MKNKIHDIRLIQLLELQTLIEIDKYCKNLNIKYYLIAGTLLGSIRHKGFIPWDTDMDIAMYRKDYDNFLKNALKTFDKRYYIQSDINDNKNRTCFTKVRLKGTYINERGNKRTEKNHGFYVDIFPLDDISKKPNIFEYYKAKFYKILIRVKAFKNGKKFSSNFLRTMLSYIISIITVFIPVKFINKFLYKSMTKENNLGHKYITNYNSKYGIIKQTMKKNIYGESKKIEFEKFYFDAPNKYEEWLNKIYGDYNMMPKKIPDLDKLLTNYDYSFGQYDFLLKYDEEKIRNILFNKGVE